MKTIGLIGGLSWQSTAMYYRLINEEINTRLGKNHSARICMYSFDFQEIEDMQHLGLWDALCLKLQAAAMALEKSGAEILIVCSNTMHRCFEGIKKSIGIPILHIAESAGRKLSESHISTTGILGTRFLVQSNIYPGILENHYGIRVFIPSKDQIMMINTIIYSELVKGIIKDESRNRMLHVIDDLIDRGAKSIILGCTEIPLLIHQDDCRIPVIDTTYIHAISAVNASMNI